MLDRSLKVGVDAACEGRSIESRACRRADSGSGHDIAVGRGENVKKGDRLLVMEAMKMQTTVYAPIDGKVEDLLVQVGNTVEAKDLIAVIG